MDELKPCPFCGGEAILEEIPGNPDSNDAYCWAAGCKECDIGWYGDTKEDAIEKWNRRSAPENKPLSLEELKQMDTKPVYCVGMKNKGLTGWGLVCTANNKIIDSFCDMWAFEDYEKEYVSYARKPEQEEK